MKYLIFLSLAIFTIACQYTKSEPDDAEATPETTFKESDITYEKVYLKESEDYVQRLEISQIDDTTINFRVALKDNVNDCINAFKGIAINHYSKYDGEMDEDEEGNGYPSNEYIFEQEQVGVVAIRIDAESGDKAKVFHTVSETSTAACLTLVDDLMKKQ